MLAVAVAAPALAAGGPHLVDDAGTVAVGTCELEAYASAIRGASRSVVSPTCAFRALGNFEIGVIAALETPGNQVIPGVSVKTGLGQASRFHFAAELSGGFDPEGNQLDYISTNVPIDIDSFDWLQLHANLGLDFEPGAAPIPTGGFSILVEPATGFQLVAEIAARSGFGARRQFGVRYQARNVTFDALYSRNIDERHRGGWATLGITWAFQPRKRQDRID